MVWKGCVYQRVHLIDQMMLVLDADFNAFDNPTGVGYCTVYCATNPRIEDSFTYCVPLWSSNVNEWFLFNRHSLETPFIGVDYYHTLVIILIGYKRVNEPLRLLTLHTSTEINSEATKMTDCFISKLLKLCRFQFTCYFRIKIISHNYSSSELFLRSSPTSRNSLFVPTKTFPCSPFAH
jgi:hypothetical protein